MTPLDAARRWSVTWQRAWEAFDTEAIVALYATDAVLSTEPFREPYRGRDGVRAYVSRVFGEEADPQVHFGTPIVDGDRAAVPWWASLREEGVDTTLAGTSVLRFDPDGLAVEQWDAWNLVRERRQPPTDWSPFAGL
ncbi:MAG: nuclear transport factor 2 family protein [Acidimicrobiia bacterium]